MQQLSPAVSRGNKFWNMYNLGDSSVSIGENYYSMHLCAACTNCMHLLFNLRAAFILLGAPDHMATIRGLLFVLSML